MTSISIISAIPLGAFIAMIAIFGTLLAEKLPGYVRLCQLRRSLRMLLSDKPKRIKVDWRTGERL